MVHLVVNQYRLPQRRPCCSGMSSNSLIVEKVGSGRPEFQVSSAPVAVFTAPAGPPLGPFAPSPALHY